MTKKYKVVIGGIAVIIVGVFCTFGIKYYLDHRTVINGIPVPPMPNKVENNKTLLGIDVNNNGVRDDIEREIADQYGDMVDQYGDRRQIYRDLMAHFRAIEANMANPTEETQIVNDKTAACIMGWDFIYGQDIVRDMLNTKARVQAYAFAGTQGTHKSYDCHHVQP